MSYSLPFQPCMLWAADHLACMEEYISPSFTTSFTFRSFWYLSSNHLYLWSATRSLSLVECYPLYACHNLSIAFVLVSQLFSLNRFSTMRITSDYLRQHLQISLLIGHISCVVQLCPLSFICSSFYQEGDKHPTHLP